MGSGNNLPFPGNITSAATFSAGHPLRLGDAAASASGIMSDCKWGWMFNPLDFPRFFTHFI